MIENHPKVYQGLYGSHRSYDDLDSILTALSPASNMVWIAKDYSVADLCRDLERIKNSHDMDLESMQKQCDA